jgi:Ca-activated chloride channel homolog
MSDADFANLDAWTWGLAVVAMLYGFVWLGLWRRARLRELEERGPLPRLLERRGRVYYVLRGLGITVATALLVLTLMRPRYGTETTEIKNMGIDIAVVMDASKSMMVPDVVPNRLSAARQQVSNLLKTLPGGRISLVPFAGASFIQTQLTSDFEVVKTYLEELRVHDMPGRGTAIGRGILEGVRSLVPAHELAGDAQGETEGSDEGKSKVGSKYKAIILFTDGGRYENPDTQQTYDEAARKAAKTAAEHNITIYTVGVGTGQGRPVPLIDAQGRESGFLKATDGSPLFSQLHAGLLSEIATSTQGDTFHLGPQGMGLGQRSQLELVDAIAQLGQKEFEAAYPDLRADRYQWPLLPAILILLLEAWISGRPRRKRSTVEAKEGSL